MQQLVVILAVFAVATAQSDTTPGPSPTPDPNFQCPSEEGLYPHPDDCSKFYSCSGGLAWLFQCSANLWFDPDTGICDWPEHVDCKAAPSARSVIQNQECLGLSDEFNCVGVQNQAYPHPELCDYYFDCYENVTTLCRCLDGWLFDLKYRGCNYPEQTDCGNRTIPEQPATSPPEVTQVPTSKPTYPGGFVCPDADGLYPNPLECSSFYNCVAGNGFLENCPGNLVFNPELKVCDFLDNVPSCKTTVSWLV